MSRKQSIIEDFPALSIPVNRLKKSSRELATPRGLTYKAWMNNDSPRALALFSGGLDSILAAKLLIEQGVGVKCLHFVTPFFGNY